MADFIAVSGMKGHTREDLLSDQEPQGDEVKPSEAPAGTYNACTDTTTLEALDREKLDTTLLRTHLVPRLKGDRAKLVRSLTRGMQLLHDEALKTKQEGKTSWASSIAGAEQLLGALRDAVEEDRLSLASSPVAMSSSTGATESTSRSTV